MLWVGVQTLLIGLIASWLATPLVARLVRRLGAVDAPGPRRVHGEPLPRMGGLAVFVGFAVALGYAVFASGLVHVLPARAPYWVAMAGAATCILLLGLEDDLSNVSFQGKFVVQFAAALTVWVCGFRVQQLSWPFGGEPLSLGWLSLPVTVLWIVGITNAVNLIDGLDGLAAGSALIAAGAVAIIAFDSGRVAVMAAAMGLAGSLLGFLRFNFSPARILLGDSGSMFLGFLLAVIAVHGTQRNVATVAVLAPVLVLGLPILDTGLAVVRRLHRIGAESAAAAGRPAWSHFIRNVHRVFLPDREHVHHRLLDLGLSQRAAVLLLYGVVTLMALAALAAATGQAVWVAVLLLGILVVAALAVLGIVARRLRAAVPESAPGARATSSALRS